MEPRETFDTAALAYERYRPGHAPEAFDALAELTGLPPPRRILEIGCGPGQASLPLLERGYRVHAVELGAKLAARVRERAAGFPEFSVEVGTFEAAPLAAASADIVFSASAFHWVDRAVAYPKIHQILVPGGALALMWSSELWAEDTRARNALFEPAFSQYAPELVKDFGHHNPGKVNGIVKELQESTLFKGFVEQRFSRPLRFDPQGYVNLLSTYSAFIALDPFKRERLFDSVREIIDRACAGHYELTMVTRLIVVRRP